METVDAVLEIAGADAFAAAISYAANHQNETMLPTYVQTGTEYGDFGLIERHVGSLRSDLEKRFKIRLLDLSVSSNQQLWHAINGRFMKAISDKFGFYTPCIGCHLYLHLMRIPAALKHKSKVVVTGERTVHGSGSKINQTQPLLDCYKRVMASVGVTLEMPVSEVKDSGEIKAMASWLWEEGGQQMDCVLSGNYRMPDGTPHKLTDEEETRFIGGFLLPLGERLARMLASGENDYVAAVGEILGSDR